MWEISLIVEKLIYTKYLIAQSFLNWGKFLDCGKIPWFQKISSIVENFLDCGTSPWLWKISLIVEIFLDWEKFSLTMKIILDCGIFSRLWKISLIVENFLDWRNFLWLWKTYFFRCRKNNSSINFENKCWC